MNLEALLFDVDGTLAESEDIHREAFNAAFREFGVSWHWDRAIYREILPVGGGRERIRHYIERSDPETARRPDFYSYVDAMYNAKSRAYVEILAERGVWVRPGVWRLLNQCRDAGTRLAICSAASERSLRQVFENGLGMDVFDWFEVVGHSGLVSARKPAPDVYSWVLREMDLPPQACLAIEDSPQGLCSSLAAGVAAVVSVSKYFEGEDFPGAVAVVSDLGEPDRPFTLLSGDARGHDYIDLDLLRTWHADAYGGADNDQKMT